jgi:SNF2 family DNA or RNA helicase
MTKYELNEFQKEILQEALVKKSGGLSVPMGSGKTLISLKLGLTLSPIEPILIVVSKTLIENWKGEIKKFFGDDLKFQVLHSSTGPLDSWKLENNTRIVITTPDVIQKYYAILNIEGEFIRYVTIPRWHNAADGVDYVVHYCSVKAPLRPSPSLGTDCLFSFKWVFAPSKVNLRFFTK